MAEKIALITGATGQDGAYLAESPTENNEHKRIRVEQMDYEQI